MTTDRGKHTHPLLDRPGPWTEQDYLALPEINGVKIELVDGELMVSPTHDEAHRTLVRGLGRELERVLPEPLKVLLGGHVRLAAGRISTPDVVVLRKPVGTPVTAVAEVMLAAEVMSGPGKTLDRARRPALYAEAGIPWYLVVERGPRLRLFLHRLVGGEYVEQARVKRSEHLQLPAFGVTIAVDALDLRRG